MPFIRWLMCIFWSTALSASSLSQFEEMCRIEDDILINYEGQKYPKINFRDQLHEDLCFILKDPEQADIIHRAYSRHFLPHLSHELQKAFSTALLKVCLLFGSDGAKMEREGLGKRVQENEPLALQIENCLEKILPQTRKASETAPWKELLTKYVNDLD